MDTRAPAYNADVAECGFWRRGFAQGAGYALPGLSFLIIPMIFAWGSPLPQLLVLGALLLTLAVLAVGWAWVTHWPEWARWLWVLALTVVISAVAFVTDSPGILGYYSVYVTMAAATLLPWLMARIVIIAVAVAAAGVSLMDAQPLAVMMAILALAMGLMVGLALESEHKDRQLRQAEQRTAVFAVAAERERIGRDLHDILGHSLTTIAVKADLASRLVGRDDDAALAEVQALATIARQALSDVRSTASGMREVRLANEIASARSVLLAAGVEAVVPSALPPLTDERAELFGYVVREAVTNVVRHAGATTCTIECDESSVTVRDDGEGITRGGGGSGLKGLGQRVEEAGGSLAVDSSAAGTTISARMEDA